MAVAAGSSHLTRGLTLTSVSLFTATRFHSFSHFSKDHRVKYNSIKTTRKFIVNVPKNMAPIHTRPKESSSDSPSIQSVKKTISEHPVVVYSKTWCSYSSEIKSLFKRLDVQPFVVELDQLGPQGPELQEALETLTGQYTVPNVFIGGKHIGGCSDTFNLHQKGELQNLLSEATAEKKDS